MIMQPIAVALYIVICGNPNTMVFEDSLYIGNGSFQ